MKLVGTIALIGTVLITCGLLTEATMARGQTAPAAGTQPQPQDAVVAAAKGQAALAEARDHMTSGRWRLARDAYATALTYLRGNAEALEGYDRASARLDVASGIDRIQQLLAIQQQQARAEFRDALRRADELRVQKDFGGAERVMLTAQIAIRQANVSGYLGEPEFAALNVQAESLLARIDSEREDDRLREAREATVSAAAAQTRAGSAEFSSASP